jgi:hypothetical protein
MAEVSLALRANGLICRLNNVKRGYIVYILYGLTKSSPPSGGI